MKQSGRLWSRGYLPHYDEPGTIQFVTFRLADALNPGVFDQWNEELSDLSDAQRAAEIRRRVEGALDEGHGSQLLRNPVAAATVLDSIIYAHEHWCDMHAFVVMPTHVHLLFSGHHIEVGDLVKRMKSFTALNIHRKLGMSGGRLWQPEYFDTCIRGELRFARTCEYIEWNPVKAQLCDDPKEWAYSSANQTAQRRIMDAHASRRHALLAKK